MKNLICVLSGIFLIYACSKEEMATPSPKLQYASSSDAAFEQNAMKAGPAEESHDHELDKDRELNDAITAMEFQLNKFFITELSKRYPSPDQLVYENKSRETIDLDIEVFLQDEKNHVYVDEQKKIVEQIKLYIENYLTSNKEVLLVDLEFKDKLIVYFTQAEISTNKLSIQACTIYKYLIWAQHSGMGSGNFDPG